MIHLDESRDVVVRVDLPEGIDLVVLQRVTHRYLAQAVSVLRANGVAVVVDVDDDLSTIHPANPAWRELHPNLPSAHGSPQSAFHSWRNLDVACRDATLVVTTTPALLARYAPHGRGHVVRNYLADHYYDVEWTADPNVIAWPAALASHPNDPDALGTAIAQLIDDGAEFQVVSQSPGAHSAFRLRPGQEYRELDGSVALEEWPRALAQLVGVGIAPLADTKFNASKSWLKPLELAAVGAPWVGSPRVEYERLHKLGCGVLADGPSDWIKKLRALRRSEAWRLELSQAGRDVAAGLRLRDHTWRWWEAWSEAVYRQQRERRVAAVG